MPTWMKWVAVLLVSVGSCAAQETRASLSGTITDSSGSVVAGAQLRLVNTQTQVAFTAASNQLGQYRILFVNPGSYQLKVELAGFRSFVRDNIDLTVGEAATLDIGLQIGNQTETVTVGAQAPILEAEKADRGIVVDQQTVSELPTIARVPIMAAVLTPGVIWTAPNYALAPFSNSGLSSWSINGSISPSAEFLLDGAPNDMIYQAAHSIAYIPPVDAVEEFKVVTGAYDAQYGRNGGGVLSVVLKSGTNRFHGTAYEFLKRPFLDANSFANNSKGAARPYDKLDEYGFTVGGPVWIPKVYNGKDKTFFFVAFENYNDSTIPRSQVSSVPTIAQRNGDFSQTFTSAGQLMPIYDPQTGHTVNGQWVRNVFPGNIIPANRMDPVGAKIVGLYPTPNTITPGSVDWQNNYFNNNDVTKYFFPNFVARMDHNFSEKERIYGRYVYNNQLLNDDTNALPGPGADLRWGNKVNNAFVFDSITVINPNLTFDFRASVNRWTQNYIAPNFGTNNGTVIGWPQALVSQFPEPGRFPYFTLANYQSLGESGSNIWFAPTTTISLQPNIAMTRGRHIIKAGLDFRLIHLSNYQSAFAGGTAAFDQGFTRANYLTADSTSGNAVASALLGYAASGGVDYIAKPFYSWKYYAPWVQDDIKISRRLTINVGLRWDVLSPITERYNRLNYGFFPNKVNPISSQVDQTKFPGYQVYGGIGFAGANGNPRAAFNTDWNNIQPRLGAAFQLNSTTVLRAGWGISYIPQVSFGNNFGFSQSTPYVATNDAGQTPASIISNPFTSGVLAPPGSSLGLQTLLGQAPSFADPSGHIGYVHNFSLGVQKILPGQVRVEASYVGSRTNDAPVTKTYNALSAKNLALGDTTQGGNPTYLNQKVANPFQNLLPGTSLNSSTVPLQQLLLPFPEFTGLSQQNIPVGKVWYNSLQVSVQKRYSQGLSITGAYTLSKNLQALSYLNPQDTAPARTIVPFDRTHVFTVAPLYELPFGPGRPFLNSTHGIVSRLVSGWQAIGNITWESGVPMTVPSGVFVIGNPVLSNQTWDHMFNAGLIDATGKVVNQVNGLPPAFQIQPAFSLRTASLYFGNLRDRWGPECNIAILKSTMIREGIRLELRGEAFNAFNHPLFGGDPVISPTSPSFGQLVRNNGQTNEFRQIQLSGRLVF
ncbi:MAG: Outer rane receptor for ferrienterochelin and colicin [Bryobacterales bacterium]|nr:Outer rane receptor for ferrienterochelin and colicin [Bryobacterales bacterium]